MSGAAACGWCGSLVVWTLEGDQHREGVCIDPTRETFYRKYPQARPAPLPRYEPAPISRRATVLTLYWKDEVDRDEVHRLSRSWSAKISEKTGVLDDVRMQVVAS